MSYNIGGRLLEVSDKVVITIDTKKFGPRQIKKLRTMVRTGIIDINSNNATAQVADLVLKQLGAPVIKISWGFSWVRVPSGNEEFYQRLIAGKVAYQLTTNSDDKVWNTYTAEDLKKFDKLVKDRASTGHAHYPSKALKQVFKGFSFPPNEYEIPEFIDIRVV